MDRVEEHLLRGGKINLQGGVLVYVKPSKQKEFDYGNLRHVPYPNIKQATNTLTLKTNITSKVEGVDYHIGQAIKKYFNWDTDEAGPIIVPILANGIDKSNNP